MIALEEGAGSVIGSNVIYPSADMVDMPEVKPGGGFVYLIVASSRSKIGISRDLRTRLESNAMANPRPITLLHYMLVPRYQDLELKLHDTFRHRRLHGEWSDLSPDETLDVFTSMNEWKATTLYIGAPYLRRTR